MHLFAFPVLAQHLERHRVAGLVDGDIAGEIVRLDDRVAVHGEDRVAANFVGKPLETDLFVAPLQAQVPQIIGYQGRVAVDGVNFDGSGQFKFALVNPTGSTTFWSNDGTSTAGSEPTAS